MKNFPIWSWTVDKFCVDRIKWFSPVFNLVPGVPGVPGVAELVNLSTKPKQYTGVHYTDIVQTHRFHFQLFFDPAILC